MCGPSHTDGRCEGEEDLKGKKGGAIDTQKQNAAPAACPSNPFPFRDRKKTSCFVLEYLAVKTEKEKKKSLTTCEDWSAI